MSYIEAKATNRTIDPARFGAVGDGTTNDRTALTAMQTYLKALQATTQRTSSPIVIDGSNKTYAVSDTLFINDLWNVTYQNFNFTPSSGSSWTTGRALVTVNSGSIGDPVVTFRDVNFLCAHTAPVGCKVSDGYKVTFDNCYTHGFTEKGFWPGTDAQQPKVWYLNCTAEQFYNGETGYNVQASRTAYAWYINASDVRMISCHARFSLRPFYATDMFNAQIVGCHFVNGGGINDSDVYNIELAADASGCFFTNTYIDNGAVLLKSWDHSFRGGFFTLGSGAPNALTCWVLSPTTAAEDIVGLDIQMNYRGSLASMTIFGLDPSATGTIGRYQYCQTNGIAVDSSEIQSPKKIDGSYTSIWTDQTTDATLTVIWRSDAIPDGSSVGYEISVIATSTSAQAAKFRFEGYATKAGGAFTFDSTAAVFTARTNAGITAVLYDEGADKFTVRVTGLAATTINWNVQERLTVVGT